jgi:RNA polymerase sigma factor (sigma-70 family)
MTPLGLGPLTLLWNEHSRALTLYARQWLATPEDAVQEAFIKLARQTPPPQRPVSWLYVAVRRLAVTENRSKSRRQCHEAAGAAAEWFEEQNDNQLDAQVVTEALAHLPDDQREAVIAHLWGGLTFDDISELMRVSRSAAYRTYLTAVEGLRERLGEPCLQKNSTQRPNP